MKTYIMCSGGKDSVATCILAYENQIHVDGVVICEASVMCEVEGVNEDGCPYKWGGD